MRFRYSLRTLLLLTMVAALGFWCWLKWTENQRSIAALKALGVNVGWFEQSLDFPRRRLSEEEQFAGAHFVYVWPGIAADYRKLRGVRRLKYVNLRNGSEGYAGLFPVLPRLKDFTTLECTLLQLNDENITFLKQCPKLRTIVVGTPIEVELLRSEPYADSKFQVESVQPVEQQPTRVCLRKLPELTQLRRLDLRFDQIDQETVEIIGRCRNLEDLMIGILNLKDDDLRPLRDLTALQTLNVICCQNITTAGIRNLPVNVRDLMLDWQQEPFPIELDVLTRFRKLRRLSLAAYSYPRGFLDRLQRLDLPELRIVTLSDSCTGQYFVREPSRALRVATAAEVAALEETWLAGPSE